MHLYINKILLVLVVSLVTNSIVGKQWPFKKSDDPANWDWMNCTFCEIHKTGKPHFHCGIDIDVNSGNCPVRALEAGRIYEIGNSSLGVEIEYPRGSGYYQRRIRYLHLKGKKLKKYKLGERINKGDIISVVQNSKAGWTDHLHVEFYQNFSGRWMAVNPLRNNENWTLDLPDDNYPPEINDIFLESISEVNNIPSGYSVISNSGSLSKRKSAVKIHIKDRPSSKGQAYNNNKDIFSVFGNIAPVVFTRDVGTNCLTTSGEGLSVYKISYSVEDTPRYKIEFDKLDVEDRFEINKIFKTEYNLRKEDQFNGNFDYIKLYCLDENRIAPQKPVNGKLTNGIWFTKCHKNYPPTGNSTDIREALSNSEALYPDGFYTLSFEAEDASTKSVNASVNALTDNFVPYIKSVDVYSSTSMAKELIYSAGWEWNPVSKNYNLKTKKNTGFPETGGDILVVAKASEPMNELKLSVKLNQLYQQTNSKAEINSNNTEFLFKIPRKYFEKSLTGKIIIELTGKDLAKNDLFGFQSQQPVNYSLLPSRDKNGSWTPSDYNSSDKVHYILFK